MTGSGEAVVEVLGFRVAALTLDQAAGWVLAAARGRDSRLVVTLNPEIVVQARNDASLAHAVAAADLVVADGVGILWAATRAGRRLPGRVPGVDLVAETLRRGGGELRVFFLGSRPTVADRAAAAASERYGTVIAGSHHGFFGDAELPDLLERVADSGAHLLLAGLGPGQERFLYEHRHALGTPVMIGVGGTLDVLAGEARRTPAWTRRLGVEWAWRVGLDPKRWHRIPRLVAFVGLVLREGRGAGRHGAVDRPG